MQLSQTDCDGYAPRSVELTQSYLEVVPAGVLARYEVREVRNAAKVLQATNPVEFDEIVKVLDEFELTTADVTEPGKNKSQVAARLDTAFRELGWREGQHDLIVKSELKVMPYRDAGETAPTVTATEESSAGYKVDNVKGRVAVDVEWNAKDGNLDRDIGAYRAFYETGIIDGAVVITRTQSIRGLAEKLGVKKFNTTTTTNLEKIEPRMTRGSVGGCPLLVVAITPKCYKAAP